MSTEQYPSAAQSPPPYPGGQEYQTKQPVATYPQQPSYPVQPPTNPRPHNNYSDISTASCYDGHAAVQ